MRPGELRNSFSCQTAGRSSNPSKVRYQSVTCSYIEITRDEEYTNGAELDDLIPDSQYQIRIARIHRDRDNKITARSSELKLEISTPQKSVQQCYDMRTVN